MQSQTPSVPLYPRVALGLSGWPHLPQTEPVRPEVSCLSFLSQSATALHVVGVPEPSFLDSLAAFCKGESAPISVVAVDARVGAARLRKENARAELCSLDREEAQTAVTVAMQALRLADELSARYVVLRLGQIAGLSRLWFGVRAHFLRGATREDEAPNDEFLAARAALCGPHLDGARRSLDRLLNQAERSGQTLLIAFPKKPLEMPFPLELALLLEDFAGARLAPCLDVPAAHLLSTMRLLSLALSVRSFASGPLPAVGDACGAVGALPPGTGEVDVASILNALPKDAVRSFDPWPGLTFPEVRGALGSLRSEWSAGCAV